MEDSDFVAHVLSATNMSGGMPLPHLEVRVGGLVGMLLGWRDLQLHILTLTIGGKGEWNRWRWKMKMGIEQSL
jgi:hypothetical protein